MKFRLKIILLEIVRMCSLSRRIIKKGFVSTNIAIDLTKQLHAVFILTCGPREKYTIRTELQTSYHVWKKDLQFVGRNPYLSVGMMFLPVGFRKRPSLSRTSHGECLRSTVLKEPVPLGRP